MILLVRKFIRADKVYKRQNYVIIIAAIIPWLVNVTYLFNYRPFGHIDLTPYAFSVTCLITSIGLVQLKLFDIIPVARDKIIEDLSDGILVLDTLDRVVDMNTKLKKYLQQNSTRKFRLEETMIGISDENIDKLFGMNNFSTAGTYAEKGTGLGLLLCKEFVEKNNGEIWVKSEIGKGSTFSFSLPIR